ncbi:MAG: imelysin family protein [Gammaproteobacteria bacterium]
MIKTLISHAATVGAAASLIGFCGIAQANNNPEIGAVISNYADIAEAGYQDSLNTALNLQSAVERLIAAPTEGNLSAARAAWRASRAPYQQTEVFRFGNPEVDDWEGKVNAWPLDEGLIDYVATSYGSESDENPFYAANVIANPSLSIGGKQVNATHITKELLSDTLQEIDGVESNVATGYHAIEFLLWGQDLNGTGAGAGNRPASDFNTQACTGGNCERRVAYLRAATNLLIDDLTDMAGLWAEAGPIRKRLMGNGGNDGLLSMLTGMGSLSYGELAGERMKLGLMLHDPEEEHDCFSDNTHYSHYFDVLGVRNVYLGSYRRADGSMVTGPSLSDLVAAKDSSADALLRARIDAAVSRFQAMVDRAETKESYDQMLGEGNPAGNAVIQAAVDSLLAQTKAIEGAVAALGLSNIGFEGSDSLDAPEKVN